MSAMKHQVQHDWSAEQWDWPLQDNQAKVQTSDDAFRVDLDCAEYKPNEVEVSTVGQELLIHCKHPEKVGPAGQKIVRQVQRAYMLPEKVKPKSVKATMDQKGHLIIKADKSQE